MVDYITVTGTLLDHEGQALGNRRIIGTPSPSTTALIDGSLISLEADVFTETDGTFELDLVKSSGTTYVIQSRPQRFLPAGVTLLSDDYAAGTSVAWSDLEIYVPSTLTEATTLAELMAILQEYIDDNTRTQLPFSDTRLALTTGTGDMGMPNATGRSLTIIGVAVDARIAPTGADLVVDVNIDGTTIFTDQDNRPRVLAGENTGTTETIDVATYGEGSVLTVDIDQIGSSNAGGHLTVTVVVQG